MVSPSYLLLKVKDWQKEEMPPESKPQWSSDLFLLSQLCCLYRDFFYTFRLGVLSLS